MKHLQEIAIQFIGGDELVTTRDAANLNQIHNQLTEYQPWVTIQTEGQYLDHIIYVQTRTITHIDCMWGTDEQYAQAGT